MSLMVNEICIYIYMYVHVCVCVCVCDTNMIFSLSPILLSNKDAPTSDKTLYLSLLIP